MKLTPEVLAAIPRAWQERQTGSGPGRCPVCMAGGNPRPGTIRLRVDPRTGACYFCRKCRTEIMARAINSLQSMKVIPDIQA